MNTRNLTRKCLRFSWRLLCIPMLAAFVVVCPFSASSWGSSSRNSEITRPFPYERQSRDSGHYDRFLAERRKNKAGKDFKDLPPEEKARMQRQYKQWQSLPPEEKDLLRKRMNKWKKMSPKERELYQHRFQQWKQIPPEERKQLQQNLEKWDQLSPQERDQIRRRFGK